jgi:hypothetical protein
VGPTEAHAGSVAHTQVDPEPEHVSCAGHWHPPAAPPEPPAAPPLVPARPAEPPVPGPPPAAVPPAAAVAPAPAPPALVPPRPAPAPAIPACPAPPSVPAPACAPPVPLRPASNPPFRAAVHATAPTARTNAARTHPPMRRAIPRCHSTTTHARPTQGCNDPSSGANASECEYLDDFRRCRVGQSFRTSLPASRKAPVA